MSVDTDIQNIPPLRVHIVSSNLEDKRPIEVRCSHKTVTLTSTNPAQLVCGVDPNRMEAHLEVQENQAILSSNTGQANDAANGSGTVVSTPPGAITQPGVPASGVAVQNTNQFAVQVVVAGFTATQVFVNGIQVGTGNGTYTVPANGAISITYTVVGTWTWTSLQPNTVTSLPNPNGRILNSAVGEYIIPGGANEIWVSAAVYPTRVGVTIVRKVG